MIKRHTTNVIIVTEVTLKLPDYGPPCRGDVGTGDQKSDIFKVGLWCVTFKKSLTKTLGIGTLLCIVQIKQTCLHSCR